MQKFLREKNKRNGVSYFLTFFYRYEGLFAMLFMFDVEMVVFGALNLWHPIKSHWMMSLSYNLSVAYLTIIALSVPVIIFIVNRPEEDLEEVEEPEEEELQHLSPVERQERLSRGKIFRNFGIVYEPYRLDDLTCRMFKAVAILRFFFFGLVLVFAYYMPMIQISGSFMISLCYLVLLVIKRPHRENSEFFIEFITELLFTLGNFFFLVLALDENYNVITVDTRVHIGWFIVFIYIIALSISILLVLYPAIKSIIKFFSKKNEVEELEKDEESDEETPKKEMEMSKLNSSQRNIVKDK